jgi:uncharacterized protein (DUF302 family)
MKPEINFKKEITGTLDQVIDRVTETLKTQGFGILTRIDFHTKMKEKLNQDIEPTVILGACNPGLAFEGFQKNKDITSLVPCNAVVRQVGENRFSVEIVKPSFMMESIGEPELAHLAKAADQKLKTALDSMN